MNEVNPIDDSPDEAMLRSLGEQARQHIDGEVSSTSHQMARARLLTRMQSTTGGAAKSWAFHARGWLAVPRMAWLGGGLSLLALLLTALLVVSLGRTSKRPLAFAIEGRSAVEGATIRAETGDMHVHFEDGTDIVFTSGSTGRIAEVSARGARVVVGEGHAHFTVEHRPGAAWSVEAGPYVVRVTGTEFDLDWSRAQSKLHVAMIHGSVAVEGAESPVPALVTGNVLDVDASGALTIHSVEPGVREPTAAERVRRSDASGGGDSPVVASAAASASSGPAPNGDAPAVGPQAVDTSASPAASSAPAASPAPATSPAAATSPAPAERTSWSKRVELGRYEEVVREASEIGVDTVVATASLDDLSALAEASRYSGHGDVAQKALSGIRKRFASSPLAHTAAFLLGRMAEQAGSADRAIELYDEYLVGGGAFAEEALGRKLMVVNGARGRDAARPIAEAYLSRFPKGAFVKAAEQIVEDPR